jgi:hypothetical protein
VSSSFPKLAGNGFDVHLAAPSSFKMRAVVFSSEQPQCVHSTCILTSGRD